ncbi:hypothetical protein DL770_004010 [Monosporascus sp. CRB-9-2]|nr:hypothetical protein DL770_004010 [Monosporascus sp. CRB-9-2]
MHPGQAAANRTKPRSLRHWRVGDLGEYNDDPKESEAIANVDFNSKAREPPSDISSLDTSTRGLSPSQPAYGVSMTPEAIRDIVGSGWPGSRVESITPLAEGKSFNNTIYFLKMRHSEEAIALGWQDAVLKVNGTLFDGDKVQNEVACLRLLEIYCPDIPVPRVLAWSEAGVSATFVSSTHAGTKFLGTSLTPGTVKRNSDGWVLISKVPGEPVDPMELDAATIADLAIQLADIVASWRHGIPPQKHCGSLKIRGEAKETTGDTADGIVLDRSCGPGIPDLAIRGILAEEIKLSTPITHILDYYGIKLDNKLKQLESSSTYARNRHLLGPLRTLRREHLPKLSFSEMFKQTATPSDTFLFTHYDLYPRNVLVSGNPPRITGIVDWEFSGFFPPIDEFLDDWVDGDWPETFYTTYLERLEEKGVATPAKSVKGDAWQVAYWLEKIIENTAPWWLPGGLDADHVERALEKAEFVIWEMLGKLGCV